MKKNKLRKAFGKSHSLAKKVFQIARGGIRR